MALEVMAKALFARSLPSLASNMSLTLANLIGRMNLYTPINNKGEVLKVNAIDQTIRKLRRKIQPPWTLKKSTLRIFADVLEYPIASDHARLAFLDDKKQNETFSERPRYVFTSIKDFYEDLTYRNDLAEIWDRGTRYLGVRNKTSPGLTSQVVDNADSISNFTVAGDAGTPVLDNVVFQTGNSSIRIPITLSSGTATIRDTVNSISDNDYKRKYYFRWVFLDSAPTSIQLQYGPDSSNYKYANVTTQFSGAPFAADDWNLLAMDLNTASTQGTVATTFAYEGIVLTGAATGTYYLDASYLRGWILQDYWYYMSSNVLEDDGVTYKDYFAPDGATYDIADVLLGDDVWADVIGLEACIPLLSDDKEKDLKMDVQNDAKAAWADFYAVYPDLVPQMITTVYRFQDDYQREMLTDYSQ